LGIHSEEMTSALSSLSFFAGGSVGGSASDWTTILSKYNVKASDLVDAGIMEWNADLGQYIVTDTEKLWKQFKIDLTGKHKNKDLVKGLTRDKIRETITSIDDLLQKVIDNEFTSTDKS